MAELTAETHPTLCELVEECCRRKGLKVRRGLHGLAAVMASGTVLSVYYEPEKMSWYGRTIPIYGYIRQRGVGDKFLRADAAKVLYDKLKEKLDGDRT